MATETASPFVQPSATIRIPNGIVTIGGPILIMPVGRGRLVRFEMHHYCGPCPVTKNGSEMKSVPQGFWDAVDRWCAGGKLMHGETCVAPPWCIQCRGEGNELESLGGRHHVARTCERCHGLRIEAPATGIEPVRSPHTPVRVPVSQDGHNSR